jgi:hypothetical protein
MASLASGQLHAIRLCYRPAGQAALSFASTSKNPLLTVVCPHIHLQGLEPSLLEALAACDWERSSPSPAHPPRPLRRLLYLSCGYPALVTDASVLLGKAPPATRQQLRQRVPPQRESQVAAEHSAVDAVISRPPRWRLISATALLFFPGTDSIETLCVFEELPPA